MKLCAVALVLSCVISPVFLVSPINTPKVCMGTGFLPVACKEDLIASVFAGTDGAQGNLGRIGLLGPRGPKGDRASLCDQKSRTKIRCRTTYDDFLKVQREVRWMESVLHVLFGYDIDDLTKNELIKLVLTQNIKIVDDTTVIEVLDQKITNLTQKVETAGKDIHGKYIEVIKDNKKKIAEIESLTGQNKKFKDQLAELPAKEKEINDLKTQVNILKETTKGSGAAVKELTKAQARLRVIEVELKSTSEGLNAKIKILEEAIKIKTTETAVLLEKLKVSIAAANKNAEVVGVLAAEKEKLKGTILVNQAACKTNMLAKEAELDLLKKELAALKLNCKDVEKQKLLIAALNKQIAELAKEKIPDFMKMKMRESAVVVQKDYSTPQLKKCGVGMQDINKIKDNQITGSSMTDLHHRPQYGRLFETRGIKAWSTQPGPGYRATIDKWSTFGLKNQWITVDLKKDTKIIGVVTAGRPPLPLSPTYRLYHKQWVKTFSMEYKTDKSNKLNSFLDPTGKVEVFQGNTDMTTPVVNIFRFPITARWFTIRPIDYNNWMSMQFDLLVC